MDGPTRIGEKSVPRQRTLYLFQTPVRKRISYEPAARGPIPTRTVPKIGIARRKKNGRKFSGRQSKQKSYS